METKNFTNSSNTTVTTVFDEIKKTKDQKQFVKLNFDEINMLLHSRGQRCGISSDNDKKNVYHELEHKVFETRVKKTMKSIVKKGWDDDLRPFSFALCSDDGKFYIIDGQSAKESVKRLKADSKKSYLIPEKFTCTYEGEMTYDRIAELTYCFNGGVPRTSWSAGDKVAAKLRMTDGEALDAFYKMKDFQYETNSLDTAVGYMFAHKYIKGDTDPEDFTLQPYYTYYADFYRSFLSTAGTIYVESGIAEENRKNHLPGRYNRVRNLKVANLLMYALDLCVHVCKKHNLDANIYLPIYSNNLNAIFNNPDMPYLRWCNIMETDKTKFVEFAEKINLYSVLYHTFKSKLKPAKLIKADYDDFLTKKYIESKIK
jgi:hypothetical protein